MRKPEHTTGNYTFIIGRIRPTFCYLPFTRGHRGNKVFNSNVAGHKNANKMAWGRVNKIIAKSKNGE